MSADSTASLSAQVNKLNINNDATSDPPTSTRPTTSSSPTTRTTETKPSELVAVVDDLLVQLNSKFSQVSTEMLGKLDDMSKRLDALESQIRAGNAGGKEEDEM
ncbi:uncharacterized protein SEPMUDRAFT_124250 [Sphaerulina musiva SO2202]|uniref:Heat shock factor binding protein 1 n=1 Tax=Sphaerulina musiva (strain SO2202) TaxID=692275 RepID=M3C7C9_SPHMS|nr:uncharacterized protein SEPMUDRAFT_124250 [Sphaerulina musiva SO2202]EMF16171.1 hypothetical protein SEPMUDRAFT_124250 [Sphaerulina musiva SO2202]